MKETLTATRPSLGFAGVGWIGKNRLQDLSSRDLATVGAIADPDTLLAKEAKAYAPEAKLYEDYQSLLKTDVAGVVIASPSALHAEQALQALQAGKAVFCQKPLGRTAAETRQVVETARERNLLLGVDLSYRYTEAVQQLRQLIASGELGEIYAVDLTFHNAYGPDKPWYYDFGRSGGGCVMDLGIHLADLALWLLKPGEISHVQSDLFCKGQRLETCENTVEDYATAQFRLNSHTTVRLNCSWNLPAGQDAVIGARFYGTKGGAAFRNLNGSFYDFVAEHYQGTQSTRLSNPPDDWGVRALENWVAKLSDREGFNPEAASYMQTAELLDQIYGR